MKIKITILTENDIPASALNGIDEEQIKSVWQSLLDLISVMPAENNDRATVLSAEFVEEEGEAEWVEIVRCKDCKYCDRGIDEDGNPFLKCLGWAYGGTQEEDFCSHAERRTDATDQR